MPTWLVASRDVFVVLTPLRRGVFRQFEFGFIGNAVVELGEIARPLTHLCHVTRIKQYPQESVFSRTVSRWTGSDEVELGVT